MDETYLLASALYVEMNPVRANLAPDAASWPWSSARAHLTGKDDELVKVAPLLEMVGDWKQFLAGAEDERLDNIRRHERTGRPLGADSFVEQLETAVGRTLTREKPGPKGKRS
jgi:putative transposase